MHISKYKSFLYIIITAIIFAYDAMHLKKGDDTSMGCFLFIIFVIVLMIFIIIYVNAKNNNQSNVISYSNSRPKIGAEVSEDFYDSVREYCRINSITVSALIRKAVGDYIGFDQVSSGTTFLRQMPSKPQTRNPDGSWKCPLCGTLNASYVGSCGCGGNRESSPKSVPRKRTSSSSRRKDGSWKCPKCGTVNAAYVGSCSCGKSKY